MNAPPEFRSDLAPILITSPTTRCGTTLMQRLLCSSSNAVIFGETVAGDFETLLQMHRLRTAVYSMHRAHFDQRIAALRRGEVNEWMLDLTPDSALYLAALAAACAAPLDACRVAAERDGLPLFGVKFPGWTPQVVSMIAAFLPQAKWLYLHRDLESCVRSAKARGDLSDLQSVSAFCTTWTQNMTIARGAAAHPSFLLVDYAALRDDTDAVLDRVEAFTGVVSIDRSVMQRRINADGAYIAPAALTDEERAIVARFAGT